MVAEQLAILNTFSVILEATIQIPHCYLNLKMPLKVYKKPTEKGLKKCIVLAGEKQHKG